jgi:hypothetical protein
MTDETNDYDDEEIEVLIRAAAHYEEVADEYVGHFILTQVAAVFGAVVDDARSCKLETWLEHTGENFDVHSNKEMIAHARALAGGLRGSSALNGTAALSLERGSEAAVRWFEEWATVFLQTTCHSLLYAAEALERHRWDRLRIILTIRNPNGKRFTLSSSVQGTESQEL